ncbi:Variant-specific surface protein, partial [Giardia duodenalis]
VCVAASADSSGNTCDKGVCTTCARGYFLHYGSCYKFGGSPGANICSDTTDTIGSVCDSCGSKFLRNPSAGPSATSCFACYGLDGTLFCERCRMNVLTSADVKPTLCTQCKIGYVPVDGRCISTYSASAALAGYSDVSTRGFREPILVGSAGTLAAPSHGSLCVCLPRLSSLGINAVSYSSINPFITDFTRITIYVLLPRFTDKSTAIHWPFPTHCANAACCYST